MGPIPDAYRSIVSTLIVTARRILERGESLTPFAFVGNLTTNETFPVNLNAGSDEQKDDAAYLVRRLADLHQADFVFLVMEAWSLPTKKMGRLDEILDRYGSIGASPHRIDVVSFALETRHGIWSAMTPIKPKGVSKKKRTFGTPIFRHFTEAEGRFVDLLPVKDGKGDPPATLH